MSDGPGDLERRGAVTPAVRTAAHEEGALPPAQRRLTIIVCVVAIVVMVVGCITVNLVFDLPIDWYWVVAGTGLATLLIALFMWVRLSE